MYDELVKELRDSAEWADRLALLMGRAEGDTHAPIMRKAADAIEELSRGFDNMNEANIALYGALPKWIPVTERLPEPYTWVLVSAEKHEVAFDAFYDGAKWKDAVLNGLIVTHWMPLPEPPKEE